MSLTAQNTQWKDEYYIGHEVIDQSRRKLFRLAQSALDIETHSNEEIIKDKLKRIIDELSYYVSSQFSLELHHMQNLGYIHTNEHAAKHKKIVSDLNKFISRLKDLSIEEVKIQLFAVMKKDFIDHIAYEDTKIIKWQNSMGSFKKSFEWKPFFELKEPIIDEMNQKLFMMAEEAFLEANHEQRDEKVALMVMFVKNYMQEHYRYEEALMNEHFYPHLAQHVAKHRKIINQINHFIKTIPEKRCSKEIEEKLANIIESSLVCHVMDEDRTFREWYKDNVLIWEIE